MDIKLQEKLFKKYPKIFCQKELPITESCMAFGIETPSTWYPLLDALCFEIQEYIDKGDAIYKEYPFGIYLGRLFGNPRLVGRWVKRNIKQVEAVQVKEKFGTLRFYVNHSNNAVESLISLAESLTTKICARCGSTHNVQETRGWITYLCETCRTSKEIIGKWW